MWKRFWKCQTKYLMSDLYAKRDTEEKKRWVMQERSGNSRGKSNRKRKNILMDHTVDKTRTSKERIE